MEPRLIHHTYTHYNLMTGLPCACKWGKKTFDRRTASTSAGIRKLRKQDQKIFRDEAGQRFLNTLQFHAESHPEIEPLVEWMASRYKHGEFDYLPQSREEQDHLISNAHGTRVDRQFPALVQWFNARNHPMRRGVNMMEKSWPELSAIARDLVNDVQQRQKKERWLDRNVDTGSHAWRVDPSQGRTPEEQELLAAFPGHTIKQLMNYEDCEAESEALGHCIGQDDQRYKSNIAEGNIEAYSLRDADGFPRVTWHFNPDGSLAHLQGRSGGPRGDMRQLISIWHDLVGKDDDDGGDGDEQYLDDMRYDREVTLPEPDTVEEYNSQYHPNDANYMDWAYEYADNDIGENTRITFGAPNWESIYHDLKEQPEEVRHDFFHNVLYNGDHDKLGDEIAAFQAAGRDDPTFLEHHDHAINAQWQEALKRNEGPNGVVAPQPQTGSETGWATRWRTYWHDNNEPLFRHPEPSGNSSPDWGQFTHPWYDEANRNYREYPTRPELAQQPPYKQPEAPNYQLQTPGPLRIGNILDPIQDSLDARIWKAPASDRPLLKGHIKQWLVREIYLQCEKFHPNPEQWARLVITGSLTTYQYSDDSDLDVSVFVDGNLLPNWDRAKLIGYMVTNLDGQKVPGCPFPLQCFVVPPTITPYDLYQPGLRSGYDVESDTWLEPPDRTRIHDVEREFNADYTYALESADKMERLLRYAPDRAVDYWHQIHKRRRRDQAAGKGDYSQANIVYKFLANRGLFPEIAQASGEYIARLSYLDVDPSEYADLSRSRKTRDLPTKSWMQTPEMEAAWMMMQHFYPHADIAAPWLMRQVHEGQIHMAPHIPQMHRSGVRWWGDDQPWAITQGRYFFPHDVDYSNPEPVQPGMIQNFPKMIHWYRTKGQGLDLNNMSWDDIQPYYRQWFKQNNPDPNLGTPVHDFGNGFTMRDLAAHEVGDEGERMNNCAATFAQKIGNGTHRVVSLRDPMNLPHGTVVLNHHGEVEDVRGNANSYPKPEYHAMLSEYLQSLGDHVITGNDHPQYDIPNKHSYGIPVWEPWTGQQHPLGPERHYDADEWHRQNPRFPAGM